jgi:hypothetical protein
MANETTCFCITDFTQNAVWSFLEEEPPWPLQYFAGPFAVALYTHSILATVAWVAIFLTFTSLLHGILISLGVPPDVGFFRFAPAASLLLYPTIALTSVLLSAGLAALARSPTFLEAYNPGTNRASFLGMREWIMQQMIYSLQLLLIAYLPSQIAFTAVPFDPYTSASVWFALQVVLIGAFWLWNYDRDILMWMEPLAVSKGGVVARSRAEALRMRLLLYGLWLGALTVFIVPVLAFIPFGMPSHLRTFFGLLAVALFLFVAAPFVLRKDGRW